MKKIALLAIGFIVCSNFIFAQECKYEKNEVDKFSGKKYVLTEAIKVAKEVESKSKMNVKRVELQVKVEDEKRYLCVLITTIGAILTVQNNKLICITSDKNTIELKIHHKITPTFVMNRNNTYTNTLEYVLDDDTFEKLLDENIKDVRAETYSNPIDFSIFPDVSTKKIFKCIK